MYTCYNNVKIETIISVAPKTILDNVAYAETLEDKRLKRKILYTGVKRRRTSLAEQVTSDLACVAVEEILKKSGWKKEEIGVLVLVTQTPDLYVPSTAMIVQGKLGLSHDLLAFDVNLGCSGFSSGIQIMSSIISQTRGKGILVVGDCLKFPEGGEYEDNNILFGSGISAVAMEYSEEATPIRAFQKTDGSRAKYLCSTYDKGHYMDGNEIVLFSLNEVVDSINEFHKEYNISFKDVDYYALHQAQKIIVDGIANNCDLPSEKVLEIYQEYGNTSGASIPFSICGNIEKYEKDVMTIFACGFGVGLAWSGVLFDIERDGILPIVESDKVYKNILV